MSRKRVWSAVLLLLTLALVGAGYRAIHQAALDHSLILACASHDPAEVHDALERGANPNTEELVTSEKGWLRLQHLLFRNHYTDASIRPLSQALAPESDKAARYEIVKMLLEHGANPNATVQNRNPLVLIALERVNDDRIVDLFLDHGVSLNTVDAAHTSLLMYAVNSRRFIPDARSEELALRREAWVRKMLERGADPNLANDSGCTALMWASYSQDSRIVRILLAHGAEVNHQNKDGQTALDCAWFKGDSGKNGTIDALLEGGADVNIKDNRGCTPFFFALLKRSPSAFAMLQHGADVRTPIPASARQPHINLVIQTGNSTMSSGMAFGATPGTTPLMFAVMAENKPLVQEMLQRGADVRAKDVNGRTALDFAVGPEFQSLLESAAKK